MRSGVVWWEGSAAYRRSAASLSNDSTVWPPPRFAVRSRSHSFAMKCFNDASRNERNRPRPLRAAATSDFSMNRAKNDWIEVLRPVRVVPRPPGVGVKRIPVRATQAFQRRPAVRRPRRG